jgi:hypothetical protein
LEGKKGTPADGNHVTAKTTIRAAWLALALSCLLPASAAAFTGAFVRGESFPTGWRARTVLIRVACPASTQSTARPGDFSFCTGRLTVTYHGRLVARAPFSVRTFDSHVEKVRVVAGARSLFRPGRRLRLNWQALSHDGQDQWATRTGTVTVFNPYATL